MFDQPTTMPSLLKTYGRKIIIAVMAIALAIFAWANLLFHVNIDANAATISPVIAIEGIGDKVEGKVEEDIGTVQRNVGKVTGQTEGALKQAQGKAKQDIGTAKNAVDNAADNAEDASENFLDSVKDLFN